MSAVPADAAMQQSIRSAPRWTGLVVIAAAVIVIAPVTASASWRWHIAASFMLAALTVVATRSTGPAPLRALVFLDVIFVVFACATHLRWPPTVTAVLVCLLPLAVLVAGNRRDRLRPSTPWLRLGRRPDPLVLILAVSTVIAAGAALTVWTLAVTPAAPPYLAQLQRLPVWLAILGVIGFALVNPIWEEAMFRGVILQDLTEIWGPRTAVGVQAVLFGAAHWAGFPSGWVGMLMAAIWGLMLGIIRLRTGGIALPYLVHVTANAAIGGLAVVLLR